MEIIIRILIYVYSIYIVHAYILYIQQCIYSVLTIIAVRMCTGYEIFTFILGGARHQQGMQSLSLRNRKPGINNNLKL